MLPALVIVPLMAVLVTMRQEARYEATAQVFLNRANLAASLAGVADSSAAADPERFVQTQADLARIPGIAGRALAAAGMRERSPYDLLGASNVLSDPDADLLYFVVRDADPAVAQRLATTYAEQFVAFRGEADVSAVNQARERVQERLDELRAAGGEDSSFYADLVAKRHQLETLEALLTASASLVRPADSAEQISPTSPVRAGALGLGLAVALAIGLAFLADAVDTRARSVEEVEEEIDPIPLVGRLPNPSKDVAEGKVAMLSEPGSRYAESIRMLRVRLGFGVTNPKPAKQLVVLTSAATREGKSTTAANLAVALAQTGLRVALCDLDTRRPAIDDLFRLPREPGLTDAVLDGVTLDDALNVVPIPPKPYWRHGPSSNGHADGLLEVLTVGRPLPDPGEFVGSEKVAELLATLRERADVVLIDTPAVLAVGDAMAVAGIADAIVVIARVGYVRRSALRELARVLASSPATPIGFVATGSGIADRYGYGWYGDAAVIAEAQQSIRQ
jgi:Mrp family chromosome partitioning ATPase